MILPTEIVKKDPINITQGSSIKISIIIVNFNAGNKLKSCLDILFQHPDPRVEIIVIDNASTDGNADYIEQNLPEIKLIRSNRNLGFSVGCNLGFKKAHGDILVFLNPDTETDNNWLDGLCSPLEEENDIGLVTSQILILGKKNIINTCGCRVHISGITQCRGLGEKKDFFPAFQEVAAISGAAFSIRRDLFERLGGFDENMFLYLEDTDLSWRARLLGWKTMLNSNSVVYHEYELKLPSEKFFWLECNRHMMFYKSLKWSTLLALLPVFLLIEFFTVSFSILKGPKFIKNKFRANFWLVKNYSKIKKERQILQKKRILSDYQLLKHTEYKIDFSQFTKGPLAAFGNKIINPIFFIFRRFAFKFMFN